MAVPVTNVRESRIHTLPGSDQQLGFGIHFTDHMLISQYEDGRGWYDTHIAPYAPLALEPSTLCFHYGQEIFEGLKAYHGADHRIRLFRHRDNIERMLRSAQRLCMPEFDAEHYSQALKQLIDLDRAWIPRSEGCSLYIRPTMIATDPCLGVRPSKSYLFFTILSPVAAYYTSGFNPISILVEDRYVRAADGGVGEAKTAGNYAASLLAQVQAQMKGFSQVLWLDSKEHQYVEEVGTSNIFFVIDDEVITSPLTGTILPGITRDSVIALLKWWGYPVSERRLSIDEVIAASKRGTLSEAFGTGTAAIVSPIATLCYKDANYMVGTGETGRLAKKLFDYLLAIQYGREQDPFGWVEVL